MARVRWSEGMANGPARAGIRCSGHDDDDDVVVVGMFRLWQHVGGAGRWLFC